MANELTPEGWDNMTVTQRVLRCREYAREAEMLARASSSRSQEYKKIAEEWHQLAAELESYGHSKLPLPQRAGA